MSLTALTYIYCTEDDVESILSVDGLGTRLDDDNTGDYSPPPDLDYLINQILPWASAQINCYAAGLYSPVNLAQSWTVNRWCAIIAARRLCMRRGNPVPKSLAEDYKETMEELASVRRGDLPIDPNIIGYRNNMSFAWSNVTMQPGYRLRKVRVETQISDPTPTSYPQSIDWRTQFLYEF
jgi:Protein of unknown function (DUF1320)